MQVNVIGMEEICKKSKYLTYYGRNVGWKTSPVKLLPEIYSEEELSALAIGLYSQDLDISYEKFVHFSNLSEALQEIDKLGVGTKYSLQVSLDKSVLKGKKVPEKFVSLPTIKVEPKRAWGHDGGNITVNGYDVNRIMDALNILESSLIISPEK